MSGLIELSNFSHSNIFCKMRNLIQFERFAPVNVVDGTTKFQPKLKIHRTVLDLLLYGIWVVTQYETVVS